MVEELRRERSESRLAKQLQRYVFGYKSAGSRGFGLRRMEGLGIGLLSLPLTIGFLTGDGFRLPRAEDVPLIIAGMLAGAFVLWWHWRPAAKAWREDPHTHRPWIDRVETTNGVMFQGMCDCDWTGGFETKERKAQLEAHRHVSRRHWPRWMGRFAGS